MPRSHLPGCEPATGHIGPIENPAHSEKSGPVGGATIGDRAVGVGFAPDGHDNRIIALDSRPATSRSGWPATACSIRATEKKTAVPRCVTLCVAIGYRTKRGCCATGAVAVRRDGRATGPVLGFEAAPVQLVRHAQRTRFARFPDAAAGRSDRFGPAITALFGVGFPRSVADSGLPTSFLVYMARTVLTRRVVGEKVCPC